MMFTENEWNELLELNQELEEKNAKLQKTVLDFQSRYHESLERITEVELRLAKAKEFLTHIAEGRIAPSGIKDQYIDEAYQRIASEGLKEID